MTPPRRERRGPTRRRVAGAMATLAMGGFVNRDAHAAARVAMVPFDASPFPYDGSVPQTGAPFLDVRDGTRRGHTAPRGGVYFEDATYADRRVLLALPPRFEPSRATLVVFLHGNLATLERDVDHRQRVVAQIAGSGRDAVLVAPQFARDALDSSAGHFWDENGFARFLDEAARHLATLSGIGAAGFAAMPVILVAYSGGYNPAAAILSHGGVASRLAGVVLLDALFAEERIFADWIADPARHAFFVSAFSASSEPLNLALQADLRQRGIAFDATLPARIEATTVAFVPAETAAHLDFVTQAWVADPLRDLLRRVVAFNRGR